ncbi:MAG: patatin-like phospholipase family protein [Gemmatimonadetes bacterium]|nr:patatin-like phospholipase family protein [Gemmatimonadota bacterium]
MTSPARGPLRLLVCILLPLAPVAARPDAAPAQGHARADTVVEALVLSGGGSRGLAHVGVVLGLEQLGHDPDLVVGTSIGALVGALYAAGYPPEEIERRVTEVDWGEIFTPAPLLAGPDREARYPLLLYDLQTDTLRFNRGFIPQWRINRLLVRLLFDAEARSRGDFDRLARRYRAVAADLRTGEPVVLARGDLALAARASMAVPGVFAPVVWDGRSLVDGGIASNVPTEVARRLGATRVIAVDANRADPGTVSRSAPAVAGRAVQLLQANADRGDPPPDVLVVPRLDPTFYGITFPADPEPLFRAGREAARQAPPAARRRPAPRPLPSPPRAFGALRVEAPDSASAALARRVFRGIAPGAYDPARVLRAVDRLYTTGLFEGVWPRVENGAGADAAPDLVVRLDAIPRLSLAGSAGYDTDRGGRFWGALQRHGSVLGAPSVTTAAAALDPLRQWASLSVQVHGVRVSPLVWSAGAHWSEVDVRPEAEDAPAGDTDVRRVGGWAGVELQQLLAERVGSAVLRAERVMVEDGDAGFSAGPHLRIAAPQADYPLVGVPFVAEAEARWGQVAYRRAAARGSLARRVGRLQLAAVGHAAAVSRAAPVDVHPALGDEHAMPGLRWGEGRGPALLLAGVDAAHPIQMRWHARARLRSGAVARTAAGLAGARWITGVELGAMRSTPFGAVSVAAGLNSRREGQVILDLGPRF